MSKFLKCLSFGICVFTAAFSMESRHAVQLDNFYPESPSIHAYNGFIVGLKDIKLLPESELVDETLENFITGYYQNKPRGRRYYQMLDLKCDINVDISKFRKIFDIPDSGSSPEFYISVRSYRDNMIDYKERKPVGFPLFRPHYAYYVPGTIGTGYAENFRDMYKRECFGFVDAYCKVRTCYINTKTRKSEFANQCWGKNEQNFSIHTAGKGNVVLSCNTPVIDAVKRNALEDNSCVVFYASKLPKGLSSEREREIYGLILILNKTDEQTFDNNLQSGRGGLLNALRNDPTLRRSNTALEIFPNLWK